MEAVSIRIESICKTFLHRIKGEVSAVDQVSLRVQPGAFLTLLGPSGCGKTTTLRMVAGFERPDRGRIFIGDEDVTDLMANRRNIGFVFQNYALFPHLSVYENVAYGLRVKGMEKAAIGDAVSRTLSLIGLKGYERQFPHQLSGGEQQRVALARAIVIEPRVLLFDEPLSNLDAKLRVYMRSEIRRLQKALSITAVYVTHDQEEAMAISDHIAVMNEGRIIQVGTAEELYHQPVSPFVAQFVGRINRIPCRVTERKDDRVTLMISKSSLRVTEREGWATPGQETAIYVRPEAVELTREVLPGQLKGRITERTFLGEKVDYLLQLDGHPLSATCYNPGERGIFALHQEIGVRFNPTHVILLKEASR